MTPTSAIENLLNGGFGHAVTRGNSEMSHSFTRHLKDYRYVAFCKDRSAISGANARLVAALAHHIQAVVGGRSFKQMGGIATRWVIASVKHVHAVCDSTVVKDIRDAMRLSGFAFVANDAITLFVSVSLPFPTFIWATLVNFFPESFLDRSPIAVAANKSQGLPLDGSMPLIGCLSHRRRLTASTFAKFLGDFLCSHRSNFSTFYTWAGLQMPDRSRGK